MGHLTELEIKLKRKRELKRMVHFDKKSSEMIEKNKKSYSKHKHRFLCYLV